MKTKSISALIVLALAFYTLATAAVLVEENQSVLILQFGRIVKTISEPGLHWKLPLPVQNPVGRQP